MHKKLLAILLAATLTLGTMGTTFAVEPTQPMDSGPVVQEDAPLFTDSFIIAELEAKSTGRAVAPYAAVGNYFGDRLTGNARLVYQQWTQYFSDIAANGTGESRVVVTGVTIKTSEDLTLATRDAFHAILKDHPELLYWMEKTKTTRSVATESTITSLFPVVKMYRGSQAGTDAQFREGAYYTVKPNENDKAAAVKKAEEILEEARALGSDYEMARLFNKRICELADYNFEAADTNNPDDSGNSNQWVDVFNGKKVTGEGYANAFKYLCDLADIGCLIVEGSMGSGQTAFNHMWNLVQFEGKWYIVDCANNDINDPSSVQQYHEMLFGVGSENEFYNYCELNPGRYVDGSSVILNPDSVLLSTQDYLPNTGMAAQEHSVTVEGGTANPAAAKVGAFITITADAAPAGRSFSGWTTSSGVTFVSAQSITTTFVMPDKDAVVTATYTSIDNGDGDDNDNNNDNDDGDSNSAGSSGTGNTGTGTTANTGNSQSAPQVYDTAAVTTKTESAVKDSVAKAAAEKKDTTEATIQLVNAESVTPEVLQSIVDTTRAAADGKGVAVTPVLVCDRVVNGAVTSRITIYPTQNTLTTGIKLGVSQSQAVEDLFTTHFTNRVKAVEFEQTGTFGMTVDVAVKLDLTGLNTKTLRFYGYSAATNGYVLLPTPAYFIDTKGYLHFSTTLGDAVVIADQALMSKTSK